MNLKWKLGAPFGIDVYVHWTFVILLWFLSFSGGLPGLPFFADVLFYVALFGCVILHELGHSLAARRYGIGTRDITLYPIGGVARLERMPSRPAEELVVAVAGPAVNVVIAVLLFPFTFLEGSIALLLTSMMWANIILVLFNMLPAFPMDGGRVLRAFLAMRHGSVKATNTAAKVGKVMAVLFGVAALYFLHPMLLLIAVFVWHQGESERIRVVEAAGVERAGPLSWSSFFQSSWQSGQTPSQPAAGQQVDGSPEWEVLPPEEQASAGKALFYRVFR
jgi:Zn-dependent protease